jgi:hypothetical protein
VQRVAPGVHTPVHAPFTHAYVQDASDDHAPLASQLCGVVPEQRVEAGTHEPEQVPAPLHT